MAGEITVEFPSKILLEIVHASFLDTKLWEFSNVLHVKQGV